MLPTFDLSSTTLVALTASATEVAEIDFNPGASRFHINTSPVSHDVTLTISGAGVVNNSGVPQTFLIGPTRSGGVLNAFFVFENNATAGTNVTYIAHGAHRDGSNGSGASFHQNSTAGSATFFAEGATHGLDVGGGGFAFYDNASAATANFTVRGSKNKGFGGYAVFDDNSTAADATFTLNPGGRSNQESGSVGFRGNATAGNARFTLNGATAITAAEVSFTDAATAGNGFFLCKGGVDSGGLGGHLTFYGSDFTGLTTTAGNSKIILEGGKVSGAYGASVSLGTASTGGQARIVARSGENDGGPGGIYIFSEGDGGAAQIELHGEGFLDISFHTSPSVTVGSLAGDGIAYIGSHGLMIGSNNLDTTFTGTIREHGGSVDGKNGSVTKIGSGSLTLTGANSYGGGTTIESGQLLVNNSTGSATGKGPIQVNGGQLAGNGNITGSVAVGTGSGPGAALAPETPDDEPATLSIEALLTFNSDATYVCRVDSETATAATVAANGVTISGAEFSLQDVGGLSLDAGTVFTVIENISANPIIGTFANLPDGGTISAGSNTFQATYTGGDGNDLTLTVVP